MSEKPLDADRSGFLSRWSRKKAESSQDKTHPATDVQTSIEPVQIAPVQSASAQTETVPLEKPAQEQATEPLPTMADVAELTPSSNFTRFMRQGVDPSTRNAAMKTLFKDPHFNVMDMMDVYVDDYSKPDPIPFEMLKTLNQAVDLGLFKREQTDQASDQTADQARDPALVQTIEQAHEQAAFETPQEELIEIQTEASLEESNKGQRV